MATLANEFWDEAGGPAAPQPQAAPRAEKASDGSGHPFRAAMGVAEIDGRDRSTAEWVARSVELGRSHIVLHSRRMVYEGRRLRLKLHLMDDRPVMLYGRVACCVYAGDGLHRLEIQLERRAEATAAAAEAEAEADAQRAKKAAGLRPPPSE